MTQVQEIEFLGMIVNSKERTISLLFLVGEKHRNIQWKDLNSTPSSSSFTDSCFVHRLGAVWQGMKTGGTWTQERRMHINEPKLLALKLALETFLKGQEITSLHIKMEYIVALTYFLKMGGTKNLQMVCLSKQIWKLLLSKKVTDSRVPSQCTKQACRHRISPQDRFFRMEAGSPPAFQRQRLSVKMVKLLIDLFDSRLLH